MAKLIVVNRGTLEASLRRLEAVHAQDPLEQEFRRARQLQLEEERTRRDAEFASRPTDSTIRRD